MIVRVHVEGNSNCNGNFKSVNCPFLVIYLLACTLVIVIKLIIVIEIQSNLSIPDTLGPN